MTTYGTGTAAFSAPSKCVRILLGLVLILAGIFVLGDVVLATLISTIFIGATAIVAGGFESSTRFGRRDGVASCGGWCWALSMSPRVSCS